MMVEKPITFKDNTLSRDLSEDEAAKLRPHAGVKLKKLCAGNPSLLLFPNCFGDNGDAIDEPLYSFVGNKLWTGNIVGFWGVNGVNVRVHSRFDTADKQYLFHYMLQRIAGVNVLDFTTLPDPESIWDFLIYLFPMALKRAVRQGIYRTYCVLHYNDDRVRGAIDVPRFIRRNIPFAGSVAYTTREHTANNHVLHLIRHTIEFIRCRAPILLRVDREMRQAVDLMVQLTPDYTDRARSKVVAANLRPVRHPFYSAYTGLQKLCLQILRHERLSFGKGDGSICGIVFDAAWLWEEYLNSVLLSDPAFGRIVHPRNKKGDDPVDLYQGDNQGEKSSRSVCYPDFYDEKGRVVLDAKYKDLENQSIAREDLYQLISYIHVLNYTNGGGVLLYPGNETQYRQEGRLRGCGGFIGRLGLKIPQIGACGDYQTFGGQMEGEERRFLDAIRGRIAATKTSSANLPGPAPMR